MLFNIFEFARKTFAPNEETINADSYSSLYGSWGATILTLSQVAIVMLTLWWLPRTLIPLPAFAIQGACAVALGVAGLRYAAHPTCIQARIYRTVASAYLLAFYAILSWYTWR